MVLRTQEELKAKLLERHEQDKDRYVSEEDAEFNKEEQAHYENENMDVEFNEALFRESYNEKISRTPKIQR